MYRFPSPRCASTLNIVRPEESSSVVCPHDQPSRLRPSATIPQYFILLLLLVSTACKPNATQAPAAPAASATPHAAATPQATSPKKAPKSQPFESISGCVLVADRSNDADSFVVRFPDAGERLVRLYFVDAPESETAYRDRLDEQGAYFGITRQQAAQLGKEASAFTAKALAEPFTVHTRWRLLFGRRTMVMITTSTGEDLGELLVRNGFARIYGMNTPLPHGLTSKQYEEYLEGLEEQAKAAGLGGWHQTRKDRF